MAVSPVGRDDEVLLEALAAALRPSPSVEPSMGELAGLQKALASGGVGRVAGGRRRLLAAAAVVVLVGSGGTAYANSPSAPREVRSVAHAIKVPGVEAPDLTDARDALDDLEEELAEAGVRGRTDSVREAIEDLDEELAELSPSQRTALEPRLSSLVARAADLLAAAADVGAAERAEAESGSGSSGSSGAGDDD